MNSPNLHVSQFTVKPSIYAFEQEVRALLYPKRGDIHQPIRDPHPDVSGFSLAVGITAEQAAASVSGFVDAVFIHPRLDSSSMMFRLLQEVNEVFGEESIHVVTDRIEALGADIYFKPDNALS